MKTSYVMYEIDNIPAVLASRYPKPALYEKGKYALFGERIDGADADDLEVTKVERDAAEWTEQDKVDFDKALSGVLAKEDKTKAILLSADQTSYYYEKDKAAKEAEEPKG